MFSSSVWVWCVHVYVRTCECKCVCGGLETRQEDAGGGMKYRQPESRSHLTNCGTEENRQTQSREEARQLYYRTEHSAASSMKTL